MNELLVFGTVACAVIAWAAAEAWWQPAGAPSGSARILWTLGAMLMVIHSVAAFDVFYARSHAVATAATARQTAAMTGVDFGGGIYLNYLFLVVWVADAAWWWLQPVSYEGRHRAVSAMVHGFLLFMFLNGAVVFADGWMQLLGAAAVGVVVVSWYRDRRGEALADD